MSTPFGREYWEELARQSWMGLGHPAPSPTDQQYDAFRHAYTSATWARMFGQEVARAGGDYIERSNPNNYLSERGQRDMRGDLINNAIGRDIGQRAHPGWTQQTLAEEVAEALSRGEFVTDKQTDPRTLAENFPATLSPERRTLPANTWEAEGWAGIDPYGVGTNWSSALTFTPRRDPLVLDLDADGLELRAADGTVLFDHNADGIRTGTGWVLPDDALLAWDRNGNGLIDSGRELFGVDTIKANGQLATDGFDALRELDSNGDGLFSAADAQFANLRLWRDADQDGLSDAGELTTLAAANVVSIALTATPSGALINNNRVDSTSAVARTGGLPNATAGAIDFAENAFAREFTGDTVTGVVGVTPEAPVPGMSVTTAIKTDERWADRDANQVTAEEAVYER